MLTPFHEQLVHLCGVRDELLLFMTKIQNKINSEYAYHNCSRNFKNNYSRYSDEWYNELIDATSLYDDYILLKSIKIKNKNDDFENLNLSNINLNLIIDFLIDISIINKLECRSKLITINVETNKIVNRLKVQISWLMTKTTL